jgi:DNA-binding response OmpR family regulator
LFVVETNEKLRDAFRDKFKAHGYRVLLSIDAEQAVKRYQQSPYHALLIDAGTVGKEGVDAFKRVLREAEATSLDIGAVLILSEEQAHWAQEIPENAKGVVLVRPVTMKQLIETIYDLAPPSEQPAGVQEGGA